MKSIVSSSAIGLVCALASSAHGQIPFAFQFKVGDPIVYKTTHETHVEIQQGEETSGTKSTVRQVKRWDVRKVDSLGVATLELSILELFLEQTEPNGDIVRFDSSDADASDPQLAEKLGSILKKPILQVQLDAAGQMKHFKHLTDRDDILRELPFLVTVPTDKLLAKGIEWQRDFPIQLDPPLGNHETIRGVQKCVVASASTDEVVVEVTNGILDKVEDPKRRMPLVQFLPKGTVTLNPRIGRMMQAKMTIDETVADFDGNGGTYQFRSTYREELDPAVQQADRREP